MNGNLHGRLSEAAIEAQHHQARRLCQQCCAIEHDAVMQDQAERIRDLLGFRNLDWTCLPDPPSCGAFKLTSGHETHPKPCHSLKNEALA